jgi:hypothetical protein
MAWVSIDLLIWFQKIKQRGSKDLIEIAKLAASTELGKCKR